MDGMGWDPSTLTDAQTTSQETPWNNNTSSTSLSSPTLADRRSAGFAQSSDDDTDWNQTALFIALPIILVILFGLSSYHCYVSNRRQAQFHERRQNLRSLERAQVRENKRIKEKKRKERLKDIDNALISKTVSKVCKCNTLSTKKQFGSMLDLTVHTTMSSDDMSISSHDIENPASLSNSSSTDDDDKMACDHQTCAICLEPFVAGKDKVSWSKYQTCRHAFHHKCIHSWLSELKNKHGNCPCCRGPYLKVKATKVLDDDIEEGVLDDVNDDEYNAPTGSENNSSADEENVQTTTNKEEGNNFDTTNVNTTQTLEFTSFCSIHGLVQSDSIPIKPIEELTLDDE